jgi:hypothetical protein
MAMYIPPANFRAFSLLFLEGPLMVSLLHFRLSGVLAFVFSPHPTWLIPRQRPYDQCPIQAALFGELQTLPAGPVLFGPQFLIHSY